MIAALSSHLHFYDLGHQNLIARNPLNQRPPILRPAILTATPTEHHDANGNQSVTIPMPEPNSSIIVDIGNGHRLIVSNKPQSPGGPCVVTVETMQESALANVPQQQMGQNRVTGNRSSIPAIGDHVYRSRGRLNMNKSTPRSSIYSPANKFTPRSSVPTAQKSRTSERLAKKSSFRFKALLEDEMDDDLDSMDDSESNFGQAMDDDDEEWNPNSMFETPQELDLSCGVYSSPLRHAAASAKAKSVTSRKSNRVETVVNQDWVLPDDWDVMDRSDKKR